MRMDETIVVLKICSGGVQNMERHEDDQTMPAASCTFYYLLRHPRIFSATARTADHTLEKFIRSESAVVLFVPPTGSDEANNVILS